MACCCVVRTKEPVHFSDEGCQDQSQVFQAAEPPVEALDQVLKDAGVGADGPVTRVHIESFCSDEGQRKSAARSSLISEAQLQDVFMSVHETFEKEAHLHKFNKHDGFISAGGDLHVETMSVEAAKEHASVLKGCKGFCFNRSMTDDCIEVHFKDHFDTQIGWTTWTSFEICREDPSLDEFAKRVSVKGQKIALKIAQPEGKLN